MASVYNVQKPLHKEESLPSSPSISIDGPKTIRERENTELNPGSLETEWLKLLDVLQASSSKMDLPMLRQLTARASNEVSSPLLDSHRLPMPQRQLLVPQVQNNIGSPSLSRSSIEKRLILSQKKCVVNIGKRYIMLFCWENRYRMHHQHWDYANFHNLYISISTFVPLSFNLLIITLLFYNQSLSYTLL